MAKRLVFERSSLACRADTVNPIISAIAFSSPVQAIGTGISVNKEIEY
ncbi:hypothetical protein K9B33_02020 [Sphingobium sp. 3R8]|nr:hypothetical protein [Sphingobium sp. 3R8]MBZ9646309.1 hypothetical protein [Sphingobium sp. 3R8]